ncbi:hypothetical protein RRG08_019211 [Elysia crispata]|uniref:Uncharacterized protein n=1 Tax=Elysia crispata TaxID=231223 RepID=A0AAE1ATM1_9GAST|nr:hypothetical protein RRG08_019211 [Elysia crispata]
MDEATSSVPELGAPVCLVCLLIRLRSSHLLLKITTSESQYGGDRASDSSALKELSVVLLDWLPPRETKSVSESYTEVYPCYNLAFLEPPIITPGRLKQQTFIKKMQ